MSRRGGVVYGSSSFTTPQQTEYQVKVKSDLTEMKTILLQLQKQMELITEHIKYMPDEEGYQEAKADWIEKTSLPTIEINLDQGFH